MFKNLLITIAMTGVLLTSNNALANHEYRIIEDIFVGALFFGLLGAVLHDLETVEDHRPHTRRHNREGHRIRVRQDSNSRRFRHKYRHSDREYRLYNHEYRPYNRRY